MKSSTQPELATLRLKLLTNKVGSGKTPKGGNEVYSNEGVVFLRSQNVYDDGLRLDDVVFINNEIDDEMQQTKVRPGDVLLNITGASIGRTCIVPKSFPRANVNQHVCIIRLREIADPSFISFSLKSLLIKDQIRSMENGSSREGLNFEQVGNLILHLPTLPTQQAIADYLDRKTAEIDTLIAKKQRLIELLQEKRQALISHAVTKGLDPNVPMKDSGVEWIGTTPRHWESPRTRFVAKLESGHTPSRNHPEYWVNCTVPWITLADVWQLRDGTQKYIRETKEHVSDVGLANSSARLLPANTVIVSRTASVGFSGIMALPMATTQDFVNWVCGKRILADFLLWVFRGMKQEFRRLMMGSTHKTIYMPDAERFSTPLPPIEEQQRIADYLDSETQRFDKIAEKISAQITKLQEYRQTLISAAVTGKIDVRKEAHP